MSILQLVWSDIEVNIPVFWPHLEEFDVCCKHLRWLSLVPAALEWFQLFPGCKQENRNNPSWSGDTLSSQFICHKGTVDFQDTTEAANTFDSLVVEETCLLSVLSAPSVSSPVDCPGEALVFFLSRLDLHWISVSRPASGDGGFIMCIKYLTAYSAAFGKATLKFYLILVPISES